MAKVLLALLALPLLVTVTTPVAAMQKGTFDYGDYTITVVPYDPSHPGHGGTFTITSATDAATVDLAGEYTTTARPQPVLTIHAAGTIQTPDGAYNVDRTWTLAPRDTHMVWRIVTTWIDSVIAS